MGQLLDGSARTTAAVRRAIQRRQASLAKLAARDDVHPKTVAKWRKRSGVREAPMGAESPCSTVLSREEEWSWPHAASLRCCHWMTVCLRAILDFNSWALKRWAVVM
jgi:hypothetical protein